MRRLVVAEMVSLSKQLHGDKAAQARVLVWNTTRLTGDEVAMRSRLSESGLDVSEADVMDMLGYFAIVNSDNAQLTEIIARLPDDRARHALYDEGAVYFASKGNAWVAISYAEAIQDPNARAQSLLRIALSLAEAGQLEDVQALMARPDFPTIEVSRRYGRALASVYAYLGDVVETERHLNLEEGRWTGGQYVYNTSPDDLRHLSALMSEDYQTFVSAAILEESSGARRKMFQFEDGVYRQLGPERMQVFLDHLSPELLTYALEGFGPYQAKTDDLTGAQETLARLRSMDVEPRFSSHLERTLAAALARDGQYQAALAQAAEFDTAYQYLSIAHEIHANTNP